MLSKQVTYLGLLIVLGLGMSMAMAGETYNIQGYLLVAMGILILGIFVIIPRVAAGEGGLFFKFLILALILKGAASFFRIIWTFDVKEGLADSSGYHGDGVRISESLWRLDFDPLLSTLVPGTRFVEGFNGIVYTFIGPSLYGGFLTYAFFAFLGSCLFYRAFRTAFPTGNRLIFAGLIFLYPSWLYWPSSIGKDALQALLIGIIAYGLAQFLYRNPLKGLLILAFATGGVIMIRPHIAAMLAVAIGVGLVVRPYRLGTMGPIIRVMVVFVAVIAGWVVINQAASFIGLENINLTATLDNYETRQERADRGGAAYDPPSITDPLGVPMSLVTVLYRPFPWEAHRGAALVLSLEGVFLVGLTIFRFGSLKSAVFAARSDPYLLFILVYLALTIFAFSTFGNFSILGRQRLQMLPFFFMLLAYPSAAETRKAQRARERQESLPAPQPTSTPVIRRTV